MLFASTIPILVFKVDEILQVCWEEDEAGEVMGIGLDVTVGARGDAIHRGVDGVEA